MTQTVCILPHVHMIKSDGLLWHGPSQMIPELEKLGWHLIVNPKRNYYMEYDKTHPSFKERELIGIDDNTEVLQVEII